MHAGHDEVNIHGVKEHESYRGDRTQASLLAFADNLAPSAGQPHHYIRFACCVFLSCHMTLSDINVCAWALGIYKAKLRPPH